MTRPTRRYVITQAAQLTAQALYNTHEGLPDGTTIDIQGETRLRPFVPRKEMATPRSVLGEAVDLQVQKPVIVIRDDHDQEIELTREEEIKLEQLTNDYLLGIFRHHMRLRAAQTASDVPKTTVASLMTSAHALIAQARDLGCVVRVAMVSQSQRDRSVDTIVVAPDTGVTGPTLLFPEPNTTGQTYQP